MKIVNVVSVLAALLENKWFWLVVICSWLTLCFWKPDITMKVTLSICTLIIFSGIGSGICYLIWHGCRC